MSKGSSMMVDGCTLGTIFPTFLLGENPRLPFPGDVERPLKTVEPGSWLVGLVKGNNLTEEHIHVFIKTLCVSLMYEYVYIVVFLFF